MKNLYTIFLTVAPIITLINTIILSIYYQKINILAQQIERDMYKTKNLFNTIYGIRNNRELEAVTKAYKEGIIHAKRG